MILLLIIAIAFIGAVQFVQNRRLNQLKDVVFEHDEVIDELWCDVQESTNTGRSPDIPPPPAETAH